jgi:hypothetical protein
VVDDSRVIDVRMNSPDRPTPANASISYEHQSGRSARVRPALIDPKRSFPSH